MKAWRNFSMMMNTRAPLFKGVLALIFFSFQVPAYSQRWMLGGKVAGQITGTFAKEFSPNVIDEDRFLFGPMAEVRLPRRFSLEVDALYKRKLNYTNTTFYLLPGLVQLRTETRDVTARSWEIPVILKWHISGKRNPAFVGGGFSSRSLTGTSHVFGNVTGFEAMPPTSFDFRTNQGDLVNPWTHGIVAAAGLDIRAGVFQVQPELRYTRWLSSPFAFATRLDTVQILVGIAAGK
jgi:hypothetical protein